MKVLLVHNMYGSAAPSGENQVFKAEQDLLLSHNHEVETFIRHSDSICDKGLLGEIAGGMLTSWNPWTSQAIRKVVLRFKPDVVHVHNTFPLISPAIFHAIGSLTAKVLTLHNYRLFCPAAIPMRNGEVCTECLDRHTVWPALWYGCYRASRIATMPLAASVVLHRCLRTWEKRVEAFIVLTEFQRERMIKAGLPDNCVYVKPNFYNGVPVVVPWANRKPCVVFVGRLTAEKGVEELIRAWILWGAEAPELRIVGDGNLRKKLEELAATHPEVPIRLLGRLTKMAAQAEIARAYLLVLPSKWFEGFPMVVVEAFASGTPVAVSDIGSLPFIVEHSVSGVVFSAANPEVLFRQLKAAWEMPGFLKLLGKGARAEFESKYTREENYNKLMEIYSKAISTARGNSGRVLTR